MLNWHPLLDKVRKKFAGAAGQSEEYRSGGRESLTRESPLSETVKRAQMHVYGMVIELRKGIKQTF
jgi:hypothetical protein